MSKVIINEKQGISILILFIFGSAIVLAPGREAKQDVWIAFFIAMLMSIPVIFVYARLLTLYPGKDLFDILQAVFGKLPGKMIGLLFVWYAFHLGSLVFRNFTEFIQNAVLVTTPQLFVLAFIGIVCIWFVKGGIEVMGRWANFFLPLVIITLLIVISLSLTEADLRNIKPVMYNGLSPVLTGAFSIFTFPFAESVIFTMIFSSERIKFNTYKVFFTSFGIGFFMLLAINVRNILVLGVETGSILLYPAYSAVSLVEIGNFLQRMEIIVSVIFTLGGIVKIGCCLYAASNGIAKVFNFAGPGTLAAPIGFLMMTLSCIIYSNTMEMFEWAEKIYPYYAMPFQVILPLIILLTAEIKVRSGKRKKTAH